jgi:hypothetical protein
MLNYSLYWKDPGGVLLKLLKEVEAQQTMKYFHEGDCGGHHYWKTTCHECYIFERKRKLLHLPLKPVSVEAPLEKWVLDFIREIHHSS